jgi:hypothetical protein
MPHEEIKYRKGNIVIEACHSKVFLNSLEKQNVNMRSPWSCATLTITCDLRIACNKEGSKFLRC